MVDKLKAESGARVDQMQRHVLVRQVLRAIPYRFGLWLFTLFWAIPSNKLVTRLCGPLRRLSRYLGGGPLSPTMRRVFLQVNFLSNWRLHALSVASESVFERYVRFKNLEILDTYYGERGVVLCNSHFGGGKLAGVLLARRGYSLLTLDRVNSYGFLPKVNWSERLEVLVMGQRDEQQFLLKALFKCQKALRKKRVVQIVADGYRGNSSVEVNFLGKQRAIRSSFAELAVGASAVVIPVQSRIDEQGYIDIEFFEPMDPQMMHGSDTEKVTQLCQSYAAWLAEAWLAEPASVFKNDIELFLRLPEAHQQLSEAPQHAQS